MERTILKNAFVLIESLFLFGSPLMAGDSGKRLIPKSMLRRFRNLPGEDTEAPLNFYALEGSRLAEASES